MPMAFFTEPEPITFKLVWKHKRVWITKTIFRKNRHIGIRLPNFRSYYKATLIKTVWYWYKSSHTDQWNRIDKCMLLLLLLLSRFSRVRLCATPETAAHQAPSSLGFSRQEHWSGLPLPSPPLPISFLPVSLIHKWLLCTTKSESILHTKNT